MAYAEDACVFEYPQLGSIKAGQNINSILFSNDKIG